MSPGGHECSLPPVNTSVFPKLPPNASLTKRLTRKIREIFTINPKNFKSKEFFCNRAALVAEQRRCAQSPHFYVIHPLSDVKIVLEFVFIFMWLYITLAVPIESFNDFVMLLTRKGFAYYLHLIVFPVIQTVVVFLFFIVGYVDPKTKAVILEPKRIVRNYLKTYFFVDLIAAGFFTRTCAKLILNRLGEDIIFNRKVRTYVILFTYAFRLGCCLIRINTVVRYFENNMKFCKSSKYIQKIAAHILKTLILLHIFACLAYGFPDLFYNNVHPKDSWLAQANMINIGFAQKYLECFLITVCYFFGASHGVYEIVEPLEQLYFSVVTLFGRMYTLFLIADLLKTFGIAGVSESKYEQQWTSLEKYMTSKNFPDNLRQRLTKYYQTKLRNHYFDEPTIMSTLSEHLRTEIFLFSARRLVQKVQGFQILPKEVLSAVIASMSLETYCPRQVIIKCWTTVEHIHFISSGTVEILNSNGDELMHLEDGDQFGNITSLPGDLYPYQVQAVEATDVFYMEKAMFRYLLDPYPEAMNIFYFSTHQRLEMLREEEEKIKQGAANFLSDLRTGKVLEMLRKRPTVQEE